MNFTKKHPCKRQKNPFDKKINKEFIAKHSEQEKKTKERQNKKELKQKILDVKFESMKNIFNDINIDELCPRLKYDFLSFNKICFFLSYHT